MSKRLLRIGIILLLVAQVAVSAWHIFPWVQEMFRTVCLSARLDPQERVYSCPMEEYNLIQFINQKLPEDSNILWLHNPSLITCYHIYPRKLFLFRRFAEGEEIVVDREFLRSRKIGYVCFDYNTMYPLEMLELVDFPNDPSKVILKRKTT